MIVCHCNRIEDGEILSCCRRLLAADPWIVVTPTAVYEGLGKRPRCGGCLTLASNLVQGCIAECRAKCSVCPLDTQMKVDHSVQPSRHVSWDGDSAPRLDMSAVNLP